MEVYRTTAQFDADGLVRATAVRALNRVRDASSGAIFVAALGDGDPQVRLEAAKALANMPTPQRVQLIIWLLDEGCSYRRAKQRLLEVHDVETTIYALSHFFHRFCEPVRLLRIAARLAAKANEAAVKSGKATGAGHAQKGT